MAVGLAAGLGQLRISVRNLGNLGALRHARSELRQALALFGEALAILEHKTDPRDRQQAQMLAATLDNLPIVHQALGDRPVARRHLERAAKLRVEAQDERGSSRCDPPELALERRAPRPPCRWERDSATTSGAKAGERPAHCQRRDLLGWCRATSRTIPAKGTIARRRAPL